MKKKHLNGWLFTWLSITVVCVLLMLLVPAWKLSLSATVMALLMLMPIRDWLCRFIDNDLKKMMSKHDIDESAISFKALKMIAVVATIILALLWMVFQKTAFNVLYSWLHSLEFIVRGRISWLSLLIYVLLTIAFVFFVRWAIGLIATRKRITWWRILIMVGGFYLKVILSALLLKFTFTMTMHSIFFWTAVIVIPTVVLSIFYFKRCSTS